MKQCATSRKSKTQVNQRTTAPARVPPRNDGTAQPELGAVLDIAPIVIRLAPAETICTMTAMATSGDTRRAIGLILIYTALLFFLIGFAARMKSDFHHREEISKAGLTTGAVLAAAGVSTLLFSRSSKRD